MGLDETLRKIKEDAPLIHHITNWVTIMDCANITRNLGALPIMAHSEKEVEEMTRKSSALVLNIGTLTEPIYRSMELSAKEANKQGIPVVLDVVGAGSTEFRTEKSKRLLQGGDIDILKGNPGEIATIAGVSSEVKGVESVSVQAEKKDFIESLAQDLELTVVITGPNDLISNGEEIYEVSNGSTQMGEIVGTGCIVTSAIATFCSVKSDYSLAASQALSFMGICGERASERAIGPGSFKMHLFDYSKTLRKNLRTPSNIREI